MNIFIARMGAVRVPHACSTGAFTALLWVNKALDAAKNKISTRPSNVVARGPHRPHKDYLRLFTIFKPVGCP